MSYSSKPISNQDYDNTEQDQNFIYDEFHPQKPSTFIYGPATKALFLSRQVNPSASIQALVCRNESSTVVYPIVFFEVDTNSHYAGILKA